jgi:hypothetical protein
LSEFTSYLNQVPEGPLIDIPNAVENKKRMKMKMKIKAMKKSRAGKAKNTMHFLKPMSI